MSDQVVMILVAVGASVAMLGVVALVIARNFRRVPSGHALIVNQMKASEPRVTFTGALVMPIVHKAEVMDLTVKQLVIRRHGRDGLICADNIRADIEVTFLVRVNTTVDDVLRVARSIGCARAGQPETLHELFDAKFSEALKIAARALEFEALISRRELFKDKVLEIIGKDLNGFVLDDLAIDRLEQTPVEVLDPNNVLDALGIQKIRRIAKETGSEWITARAAVDPTARTGPRASARSLEPDLRAVLEREGLLDVEIASEVACDVAVGTPELALYLDDVDAVAARLPQGLARAVLEAIGRAELMCRAGRARVRWTAQADREQLVAGARLVHALRSAPATYR